MTWPVDGAADRLPVEMSGLPVFDRERRFSRLSRLRHLPRTSSGSPRTPRAPVAEAISAQMSNRQCAAVSGAETGRAGVKPSRTSDVSGARAQPERPAEKDRRPGCAGADGRRFRPRARCPVPPVPAPAPPRGAQWRRRTRHPGSAPDPRPAADRRSRLPAQQSDLRQPRLPRLDRLCQPRRARRRRRARQPVHRDQGHAGGERRQWRQDADHQHAQRPGRCRSRAACSASPGTATTRWC